MAYILSSQNVRIEQDSASIAARLGAFAIDFFLVAAAYFILFQTRLDGLRYNEYTYAIGELLFILPLFYPLLCEVFMSGQTLGKRIFHIRVVSLEGGGAKLTSLILRWLLLPFDFVLALGVGELCIFFTKRQQRLGDLAAGTWVVRTQTYDTEKINLNDYEKPKEYKVVYPKAKNLSPKQASLIAEVLKNRYNPEISVAVLDLCRKVEKIVGPVPDEDYFGYLDQVLQDYRYES